MREAGNPHGYEPGFTIEQHRDELIERLGEAIKRLNAAQSENKLLRNIIESFIAACEENQLGGFAARVQAAYDVVAQGGRE